ncbi:MAG: hypothetical protein ABL962_07405, partial [Fimbriimonadaceae bacterium]
KLRGSLFMIEQQGEETENGKGNGKAMMEAIGLVSFDVTRGGFNMHLRSQGGQPLEGEAKLDAGNFVWGYGLPDGGYVRFTSTIKDNTWHERGEITQDGKQFFTFMEMNLKK